MAWKPRRKTKDEVQLENDTNQMVLEYLQSKGLRQCTPDDSWSVMYPWVMETSLGPLFVHPHDGAVFCRFDDVDRAKGYFGSGFSQTLNPFSGKYNLHFMSESLEDRLRALQWHFAFLERAAAYQSPSSSPRR